GVGISPHMFRTAAASSAAVHADYDPYLGSALLHHHDKRVTEEYCNTASKSEQQHQIHPSRQSKLLMLPGAALIAKESPTRSACHSGSRHRSLVRVRASPCPAHD